MIIGIDPGVSNIGIAGLREDGTEVLYAEQWTVKLPENTGYCTLFDSFYALLEHLEEIESISCISLEKPFFTALTLGNNSRTLEIIGIMKLVSYTFEQSCDRSIPLVLYSPSSIKKTTAGFGKANKQDIAIAVNKLFPAAKLSTTHIADAIACAYTHFNKTKLT